MANAVIFTDATIYILPAVYTRFFPGTRTQEKIENEQRACGAPELSDPPAVGAVRTFAIRETSRDLLTDKQFFTLLRRVKNNPCPALCQEKQTSLFATFAPYTAQGRKAESP
jgi:hypothetical protein